MLSRDTWNYCDRRRWVTLWTLSPHKPFWLLVMQDTIVICLRYMMIAIGAATPDELNQLRQPYCEGFTKLFPPDIAV